MPDIPDCLLLLQWFRVIDWNAEAITAAATLALAFLTLVLALSTVALWASTRKQIALARDEFEAEHRPWIAIRKIRPAGPAFFTDAAMVLHVEITIENTGSTPAIDFFLSGDGASQSQDISVDAILARHIAGFENLKRSEPRDKWRLPAEVIFPGEKSLHRTTFGVRIADMCRMGDDSVLLFNPMILGAFLYRSPLDNRTRYTTFVYTASMSDNLMEIDESGDWPPIKPTRIQWRKYHLGWTAT